MIIIYLLGLTFGSTPLLVKCTAHHCETAVSVKQNLPEHSLSTGVGARTFPELVKTSSAFVDKSLFIVETLRHTFSTVIIISPKKLGKSMNLEMMKTFLSVQVDPQGREILPKERTFSYRLFIKGEIELEDGQLEYLEQPLLIGKPKYRKLVDKYLARYPVIHLDFKDTMGYNYTMILAKMKTVLCRAYQQHPYMMNVLKANGTVAEYEKFKRMFNEDQSVRPTDLIYSMQFLSRILKTHFNKHVFVLLDNYDTPLQNFYQENFDFEQKDRLLMFYGGIMEYTLKDNFYLQQGIVMGTFKMSDSFFCGWLNHYTYNIPYKPEPMLGFFGFNQNDVRSLFEIHQIPQDLAFEAHNWYYAFHAPSLGQHFYQPWSLLNFIKERTVHSYWVDDGENVIIDKMIKISIGYRIELLLLLNKRKVKVYKNIEFCEDNFESFNLLLSGKGNPNDYDSFTSYLISKGFLAVEPVDSIYEHAFIPNNEVYYEISQRLVSFYKWYYHLDQVLLYTAASNLHAFVESDSLSSASLENALKVLYKNRKIYEIPPEREPRLVRIRRFFDGFRRKLGLQLIEPAFDPWRHESPEYQNSEELRPKVDESIEELFNCVAMEMHRIAKFRMEVFYSRELDASVVTFDPNSCYGAVIEVKQTNDSIESILETAVRRKHILQHFLNIQTMKFIAVKVSYQCEVAVMAKITKTSILRKN